MFDNKMINSNSYKKHGKALFMPNKDSNLGYCGHNAVLLQTRSQGNFQIKLLSHT